MPSPLVRLAAAEEEARRVAALLEARLDLSARSVAAFEVSEKDRMWRVEVYGGPNEPAESLVATVRDALGSDAFGLALEVDTLSDADWVAASLEGLAPVFAGRFVIHGAHDRRRIPPHRVPIEVEAALAFGTGHHGTTLGCLTAIDRLARLRRFRKVLDVGTGTGVLAIAARHALKRPVLASDIDPVAVTIAAVNAQRNRAPDVRVIHAAGLADHRIAAAGPFDLILANILARPLVALARPIRAHLAPGGHVVLSGLMAPQERYVRAAYVAEGLAPVSRGEIEGWVTLVLKRRG